MHTSSKFISLMKIFGIISQKKIDVFFSEELLTSFNIRRAELTISYNFQVICKTITLIFEEFHDVCFKSFIITLIPNLHWQKNVKL